MVKIEGYVEVWLCDKDGKKREKVVDGHNIFTNDGYKCIIGHGAGTFTSAYIELITDAGITEEANKHLSDVTIVAETNPVETYDGDLHKYYYLANAANGKYFAPPSSTRTITAIGLKSNGYLMAYKVLTEPIIQDETQYLEVAYTLTLSYATDYSDPNALTALGVYRLVNGGSFGFGLTTSANLPDVDRKLIHGAISGLSSSKANNVDNYGFKNTGSYDAVTANTGLWNGIMSADGIYKKFDGVSIGEVYGHTSNSTSPFFDSNNEATGNGIITPSIPSAWTYGNEGGRTRAMYYEIGIVDGGATGAATFKWRKRHLSMSLRHQTQIYSTLTSSFPPHYLFPSITGLYYYNNVINSPYRTGISGIWAAQNVVNGDIKTYVLSTNGLTLTEMGPYLLTEYSTIITLSEPWKKFIVHSDGTIWGIGTDNKIYKYDNGLETSFDIGFDGASPQNIESYNGYIWAVEGTTAKKLDPSNGSVLQTVTLQTSITDYERDFSVDSEGNIWNGSSKIDPTNSSVMLTTTEPYTHVSAFGNVVICVRSAGDHIYSTIRDLEGNSIITINSFAGTTIFGLGGTVYPTIISGYFGGSNGLNNGVIITTYVIPLYSADEYHTLVAFDSDPDNANWKGWDSTNSKWVDYTGSNARTTSTSPIDLEDGVQVAFQDGAESPQFVATERYIFGVTEGIVKDNLSQFKADLRIGLLKGNEVGAETFTIPSASPYTYTVTNTTSTGYVRIDSDYEKLKVMIDSVEATQVASDPTAGQYAIDFDTGILTFSADDAGKSASIDYCWLERP